MVYLHTPMHPIIINSIKGYTALYYYISVYVKFEESALPVSATELT